MGVVQLGVFNSRFSFLSIIVMGMYLLTHLFNPHLDLRSMKSVSWHGSCAVGSVQFEVLFFEHH
jgi:hypothetical protein